MPIDSSIYSQIQQPKIDNPLNALAQVSQIQHFQNQNRLADLTYGEKQRDIAGDSALAGLITKGGKPEDIALGLAQQGYGTKSLAYTKQQNDLLKQKTDIEKATTDIGKTNYEVAEKRATMVGQTFGALKEMPGGATPQAVVSGMQHLKDMGLLDDRALQAIVSGLPQDPAQITMYLAAGEAKFMSAKDRIAQTKAAEDARHHKATEKQGTERLAYDKSQPKGQVVQSDQGVMLVDPRSGTARPVTANGQQLQPKLKDLPAPISKALLENNVSLRKIEQALKEVEAYPDAFGIKNYVGDAVRQRTDPKGVNARALVADIGSLKIHDRSGAAVTAAETPRLKPFIPTTTDDDKTIAKKLNLFKQEYQAIQDDINSTYTREQGYNQRGTVTKPATTAPTSNIDDLLKKYGG